ncbi:MAG: hypothetical protein SFU85_11445 [Candidatus Methylacidiphilales bacterium]|nr:hypothetical protein [Candidatus Methylacidiphilales bacterium]
MSDSGTCGCGKPSAACTTPKTEAKTPAAAKGGTIQNGKGSAPRNISETFRSNYNGIRWTTGGQLKKGEKLVKVYR